MTHPGLPGEAAPFWRPLGAAAAAVAVLVALAERLPAPAAMTAPATEFSEARAWDAVEALSTRIGHRTTGSDGQRAAAAYLRDRLAAIHGLEVASQTAAVVDDPDHLGIVFDADVTNIVARLPGDTADAVVVSAHYDSPPESVGAADNAVAVAAALEVARALAAGPRLHPTVIFNFVDGEEVASLGSDGFLAHPWRRDVRGFINLDAAGATGRALAFQISPGGRAFARAYAAAPRPLGTVLAQDIFQSGVVPSSTDFGVYAEHGHLPGLDLALYEDGYAYHTDRDVPARIAPGTLQHLGDNLLGTLRALDLRAVAASAGEPPPSYFDVLGRWMLVIPAPVAAWLPWLALALGAGACAGAARRRGLGARRVLRGLAVVALAAPASVACAALIALVLGWIAGRPHGWYAHPALAAVYGAVALGVFAAIVRRACPRLATPDDLAVGSLAWWLILLALAALAGAGSAYLAIAWVIALSVMVLVGQRSPAAWFVAWGLAAVMLAEPALIVLQVFLPIGGRLALGPSFDPVAAALVALPAVLAAVALAGALAVAPVPRAARRAAGLAIALGLVLLAIVPPFSRDRPQRIAAEYACRAGRCTWQVTSEDALGPARALAAARPIDTWPTPQPAAPRVTVTPATADAREVTLDIDPAGALEITISLPAQRVIAWSEPTSIPHLDDASSVLLRRIAPRQPWRVRLTLAPGPALPAQITHRWTQSSGVSVELVRSLPDWCAVESSVSWNTDLRL